MKTLLASILLALFSVNGTAQVLNRDLPNSFSFPSVVPYGCLKVVPSVYSAPPSETFFDSQVLVADNATTALVRIRAWRIGCHEPNASAIMLNFDLVGGNPAIRYPEVSLVTSDFETRSAGLFAFARTGFYDSRGASLEPMTDQLLVTLVEGFSFVVDTDSDAISKRQYNDALELQLRWPSGLSVGIDVPKFDPALDPPQFANPPLHGRYTGHWVVEGLPRQGMVLTVGELPPDRNFVFLAMFTYLNGVPTWMVGNADFPVGASSVRINMWTLDGGEFFTEPLDSYEREDVIQERLGTMTIQARHCNVIDADVDFSESGLGTVARRFERLIRIAGYDCDQTR
ncbi:MAG TPA: hypothetical protein VKO85_08940 [Wenzhouxiangellaceae bacterium]|nr:hypothetical protein [Wenzhouxiangellaceae bacterium]